MKGLSEKITTVVNKTKEKVGVKVLEKLEEKEVVEEK